VAGGVERMSCTKQIHDDSVSGVPDGVAGGVVTNPMAEEEAEPDRGKAQQWLVARFDFHELCSGTFQLPGFIFE
jgi:hypothetical protein